MAIAILIEFPEGTLKQYDRVLSSLNLNGRTYKGGLFHVAGQTGEGVRVVDVWESQAAFDAFFKDKLEAALEAAGIGEPTISAWPVHNTLTPNGPLQLKATTR